MRVKGMSYLRKNDYQSISINKGAINVYGSCDYKTMRLSYNIEDDLKKLDEEGKRKRVVEYFLDYSRINHLNECYLQNGRIYLYVGARHNRSLKFSVQPSSDILKKIIAKYQRDRLTFFGQEDILGYKFGTTSRSSSYDFDIEGYAEINLCTKNGKLVEFEQKFLSELLPTIFGDSIVSLKTVYDDDEYGRRLIGYFIVGANKSIKVDYNLLNVVSIIILNHNSAVQRKLEEESHYKQLMLRMEEI